MYGDFSDMADDYGMIRYMVAVAVSNVWKIYQQRIVNAKYRP